MIVDDIVGRGKWYWESEKRYYSVIVNKDLFDDWVITKQWGGLRNNLNGMQSYSVENKEALNKQLRRIFSKRQWKGYKLVE